MRKYDARELWNMSREDIWKLPDGPMKIVFEDGTMKTNMRATVFSQYLGVFHRAYPKTPLLKKHHLGDRQVSKGVELDILGAGLCDCFDVYGGNVDIEELSLIAYRTINKSFNDFTTNLKASVSTISILDFIDVVEHPEIKKANSEVEASQLSIDHTYRKITEVLNRPGELPGNTIARMAKSNLVSMGQILQCVGPRGYLTDIDSNIFKRPVIKGFTEGIGTLYDSMVESRSASKAAIFTSDPVADTQYFNREMQLLTSNIVRLHKGDCGTTEYLLFKVKAGDLNKIAGKYYLGDDKKLHEIKGSDKHLIGSLIKIRSVLKCKHTDTYGVCSTCFGSISYSIPANSNIGHIAATVMGEKISQKVLSTKHLDGSSKVDDFQVSAYDANYIRASVDKGDTVIKLAEKLDGKKVILTIDASQAANLGDVDYHELDKLSPSTLTTLTDVRFSIELKKDVIEHITVPVSMGSRHSWLSGEAITYVKDKKWTLTDKGSYQIDLSDWDNDLPLFQLPMKHTDMLQYMKTIKKFIVSAKKSPKKSASFKTLKDFEVVDRGLIEFYNLISSKLTINLVHLEIIILSCLVRDSEGKDHRLPLDKSKGEVGSYKDNIDLRSLSAAMSYQGQSRKLTDVDSFLIKDRPDHPCDNLLMPMPTHNPRE